MVLLAHPLARLASHPHSVVDPNPHHGNYLIVSIHTSVITCCFAHRCTIVHCYADIISFLQLVCPSSDSSPVLWRTLERMNPSRRQAAPTILLLRRECGSLTREDPGKEVSPGLDSM